MSFGLGHGKPMNPAPGIVMVGSDELPPLPDAVLSDPESGRVDPRGWFTHPDQPFEIEIGSGKGTFLVQQGVLSPETNYLGIEWAGEFATYAADRVRRRREASGELANIRLLRADATEFLRWRCPSGIVRVIHLYFSDPWPKRKHHKKRVIQHGFLAEARRVLEPGGELRIVTDHDELWAWDVEHFEQWSDWIDPSRVREHAEVGGPLPHGRGSLDVPPLPEAVARARALMPDPPFGVEAFDRPESAGVGEMIGTNFERKFRIEGREFHSCVLRKRA